MCPSVDLGATSQVSCTPLQIRFQWLQRTTTGSENILARSYYRLYLDGTFNLRSVSNILTDVC